MKTLVILACMAGVPVPAFSQAAIAGSVRDSSAASIPGVIVEASSPALIEKSRTTTTDSSGQYRLEDLRPGTYKVRFTLGGWNPYEREGIELTGSFTATVDAQLSVGLVSEVITVTGAIPAIDVHTAKRELTLTGDVVSSIPTARSYNAVLVLVPGVVTNINDTVTATAATSLLQALTILTPRFFRITTEIQF
jgi:Carboxypeptidase regulatory-like domain